MPAPQAPAPLADGEWRSLLAQDPARAWRVFIDHYTSLLLALIERAGIRDRKEAMEIYVLACERLAADDCARLRERHPGRGAFGAWLSVLVRNVMIEWIGSRAVRRRLFKSIEGMPPLEQRVFELFYWENLSPAEMVELLADAGAPSLVDVLGSLDRIQTTLTQRQREELLATSARGPKPISLDAPADGTDGEIPDLIDRALAALPPVEAAILRLKYMEGLTLQQIRKAVHLDQLTETNVGEMLQRFQVMLSGLGAGSMQRR